MKSNGPSIDPWGTLHPNLNISEENNCSKPLFGIYIEDKI